jgi:hypothetical protein
VVVRLTPDRNAKMSVAATLERPATWHPERSFRMHLQPTTCSFLGCDLSAGRISGFCRNHYRRLVYHGQIVPAPRVGVVERFFSHVNFDGPMPADVRLGRCWEWTASKTWAGYGRFRLPEETVGAHRWAYEQFVASIPGSGLEVDHLCRNRLCVNFVAHLELVTARENNHRSMAPSAENVKKTHCIRGHPFDEENTRRKSNGGRRCFICSRIYTAERRARKLQVSS